MATGDVIKTTLSNIKEEDLIPASKIKDEADQKRYKEITGFDLMLYSEVSEIVEKVNIDPSKIYFSNSTDSLSPYFYYDFPVFIEIMSMSIDFLKTFLQIEERVKHQMEFFQRALKEKDFNKFFALAHTKIKITAFNKVYELIPDEEKYSQFIEVYVLGDYGFQHFKKEIIEDVFNQQPDHIKQTCRKELDKISDKDDIVIYRGVGKYSNPIDKAYSWTLNLRIADTFANHYENTGTVYSATVKKSKVVDLIDNRHESEIIVRPEDVENIEVFDMIDIDSELDLMGSNGYLYHYHTFLDKLDRSLFKNPNDLHGYSHTQRVLLNALSLCNAYELDDLDTTKICLAAIYHDIGRDNDEEDEIHGRKSWEKLVEMDLISQLEEEFELYDEDLEIIKFLVEYHCLDDKVAWKNIESVNEGRHTKELRFFVELFKDADGLDRVRLKDLDSRYLRLDESKKRVNFAQQLLRSFR